ncbi:MAG TPA: MFS transporter [Acidimicrobiales bacterium]|nr:MFS transporter [Acidimicrobiales bacterium]
MAAEGIQAGPPADGRAGSEGTWAGLERRWWTLIAVCGATFMLLVDVTIVQVALPTIQRHLGASFTDLQWVIDAYALSLATLILTWGSTADRFGRKRIFVLGLVVFTLASLLCGVATTSTLLIWARALQGVGGAAMFATGLALIGQDFRGAERGKAIAAWGATVGGAVAIGPLIGGVLTNGLGWRWIFFVNVPIGIVTCWLSLTRMVNVGDPGATRLDVAGLVTFSASMFLLVFGIIRGNAEGWTSPFILSLLGSSVLAMLLFVVVEHLQRRPMFDLSLFRKPAFTGVSFATFAIGAGMFAMLPFLTFYLQNDLGYSPLAGGLRLLPATVLTFVVPLAIRPVAERMPPGVVLGAGLAITALGLGAMLGLTVTSTWVALVPGLLLTGFGIGVANPTMARIALGVVPPERSGMASGISNTFRIGGLATGVAALGAIFERGVAASFGTQLGHPEPGLAKVVSSAGVKAAQAASPGRPAVTSAAHVAFMSGLHVILVVGTVLVALGAIAGFALVRARDFHRPPVTGPAPSPGTAPAYDPDTVPEAAS